MKIQKLKTYTRKEKNYEKNKTKKKQTNQTLKDKVEYAELNKLVKKKRRARAQRKRKELINTGNFRSKKGSKTDQ